MRPWVIHGPLLLLPLREQADAGVPLWEAAARGRASKEGFCLLVPCAEVWLKVDHSLDEGSLRHPSVAP